jgi:hypothetical protein
MNVQEIKKTIPQFVISATITGCFVRCGKIQTFLVSAGILWYHYRHCRYL